MKYIPYCASARPLLLALYLAMLTAGMAYADVVDDFNDNSLNVLLWEPFYIDSGVFISEEGGRL